MKPDVSLHAKIKLILNYLNWKGDFYIGEICFMPSCECVKVILTHFLRLILRSPVNFLRALVYINAFRQDGNKFIILMCPDWNYCQLRIYWIE